MKFGKFEIKFGMNEIILGSVVFFTLLLAFHNIPKGNLPLFEKCLFALVAWAGAKVVGSQQDKSQPLKGE